MSEQIELPLETGVSRAITLLGGASATARRLNPPTTPQAVSEYLAKGYAPPHRAVELEALTGIPREDLVKPALRCLLEGVCDE